MTLKSYCNFISKMAVFKKLEQPLSLEALSYFNLTYFNLIGISYIIAIKRSCESENQCNFMSTTAVFIKYGEYLVFQKLPNMRLISYKIITLSQKLKQQLPTRELLDLISVWQVIMTSTVSDHEKLIKQYNSCQQRQDSLNLDNK